MISGSQMAQLQISGPALASYVTLDRLYCIQKSQCPHLERGITIYEMVMEIKLDIPY